MVDKFIDTHDLENIYEMNLPILLGSHLHKLLNQVFKTGLGVTKVSMEYDRCKQAYTFKADIISTNEFIQPIEVPDWELQEKNDEPKEG